MPNIPYRWIIWFLLVVLMPKRVLIYASKRYFKILWWTYILGSGVRIINDHYTIPVWWTLFTVWYTVTHNATVVLSMVLFYIYFLLQMLSAKIKILKVQCGLHSKHICGMLCERPSNDTGIGPATICIVRKEEIEMNEHYGAMNTMRCNQKKIRSVVWN